MPAITQLETMAEELLRKWLEMQGLKLVSVAEFYLAFGRGVKFRMRHGMSLQQIAISVGLPLSECRAAVQYADSPDWFKFQVLTEGWSWKRIREALESSTFADELPSGEPTTVSERVAQGVYS